MSLLPRFFVLQSTGKYLSVTENLPSSLPSGFLKFNEEQIWSPRVKFAVEQAATGDDGLVHIRSCHNNKYWVAKRIQSDLWIVASADKPDEDRSKDTCTLFEPVYDVGKQTTSFRHVNTQSFASLSTSPSDTQHGVMVSTSSNSSQGVFSTTDWETLVILPSQVSFRSQELEGGYLCSRLIDGLNYHRFESGLDVGDPLVAHELLPTNDGNYRIKNVHFDKLWRGSNNWVRADTPDNATIAGTLFSVVKISDKLVGLRSLVNNNFCGGRTAEGKTNCLSSSYPTLSRQTLLIVEERVLDRNISNVRYRLSDSRIYNEEVQEVSHAFATNDSVDTETTVTLSYSSSESRTTTWANSNSVNLGVSIYLETSNIPIINGGIELSTEYGYTKEWGEEQTTERKREATYAVVVPPLTTIKVTLLCTKAACDVPFSYRQRDLLTNGQTVTTIKDDGIFTGINSFNFYFQSSNVEPDPQGKIFV